MEFEIDISRLGKVMGFCFCFLLEGEGGFKVIENPWNSEKKKRLSGVFGLIL